MKHEYIERLALLAMALLIISFGIALCVRADLGITPISCPPYVLSLGFKPSIGFFTMTMYMLFIVGQLIILGHDFKKIQFLQIAVAVIFGSFVDFSMYITRWIDISSYIPRMMLLISSCAVIAVGVILQVKANAIYLAGEGIMLAISRRSGKEFSRVKVVFDCSLLLSGVIISLISFGEIRGIREGSVISAVLVGVFVGMIRPHFDFVDRWLERRSVHA